MKITRCLLIAAVAASFSYAPNIAAASENIPVLVIDSGSDFTHKALKPLARPNLAELNGKAGQDDDKNGLIDDVFGWNFVDNNSTLVDLSNTPPDYDKVLRSMELLGKLQAYGKEGMSKEEFAELVTNYNNKELWAWVGFVGGWAHGTHCAGIVSTKNSNVALNAIKHLPTGDGPKDYVADAFKKLNHMIVHRKTTRSRRSEEAKPEKVTMDDLDKYFTQLGVQYAQQVKDKAEYIGSLDPRLINCSFGSENSNLVEVMKQNMAQWGWTNPSDEEVQKVVNLFVTKAFLPRDKAMFAKAKNALVFIAAGNSSEDLDPFVMSPNCVPIPNKIVIAATDEDQKIAAFSCYGKEKVDVAVPGVNIFATYPNQKMGYMSGTSMACPLAVNYGAQVLFVNPDLSPVQLKKVLMETVDKKDWLAEKVVSGGVINVNRAKFAAKLIKEGKSIDSAISEAREKVADKTHRSMKRTRPDLSDPQVKELYFSIIR